MQPEDKIKNPAIAPPWMSRFNVFKVFPASLVFRQATLIGTPLGSRLPVGFREPGLTDFNNSTIGG
jgi:hypothetical protein